MGGDSHCLFYTDDPNCAPTGFNIHEKSFGGALRAPSYQIFADPYPGKEDWIEYDNRKDLQADLQAAGEANDIPEELVVVIDASLESYGGSRVSAGQFETVSNEAWLVKEGYKVNLILFEMGCISQESDPIIWPGDLARLAFQVLYEPIAHRQMTGSLPYLKQWLKTRTISQGNDPGTND